VGCAWKLSQHLFGIQALRARCCMQTGISAYDKPTYPQIGARFLKCQNHPPAKLLLGQSWKSPREILRRIEFPVALDNRNSHSVILAIEDVGAMRRRMHQAI